MALPIELKSGQFITGRIALHKEFYLRAKRHSQQVSPLTLWRKLEVLQALSNLNIRSHAKYSIISISNWSDYQKVEQPVNNRRTTGEQPVNTDKKEQERKEFKEPPYNPPSGKKPRKTPTPDIFPITPKMQSYADQKNYHGDITDMTEAFLDHHRARDTRFLDWNAAWQNWLRNEIKFNGGNKSRPTGQTRQDRNREITRRNLNRFIEIAEGQFNGEV